MKPETMQVQAQNIPPELMKGKRWIVWKWEQRKGSWTKPLYNPKTSQYAKSDDPSTWTNFAEAWRCYESGKYDGIGYVLSKADGFCGIDYDKVRDPQTGEINPEALARIKAINSYTEISPSQKGFKTITKAKLPGRDRQSEHYSFYSDRRYFCITGHIFDGISNLIEKRQDQVLRIYNEIFPPEKETSQNQGSPPKTETHNIEDSKIIEKALAARDGGKFRQLWEGDISGYPSQSEADQALCNKLAFWVGTDPARIDALFRRSGLNREKWNREDYRQRTIERAISQARETYKPRFAKNGEDSPKLEKTQRLDFPPWIMTGVAGDFAELYSTYLEPPKHFFWLGFNTCLGSVLTSKVQLPSEISPETRLFFLLLGQSADERKSTAIEKTVEFFRWAVDGFYTCWGVGSAEGLQKRLEKHRSLLLCFDEFRQFTSKSKIEGSILLECVNTLFESNRFEANTKQSHVLIEDAHLAILAASTVDTYDNTWSSHFSDIGFTNRLFVCPGMAAKQFSLPPKVPDSEKTMLRYRLGEILRHTGGGLELQFEPQAKELYHQWYMNLDRSVHAKRLDGYALRFMILLAVNQLKTIVDEETVNQATALCDWQLRARKLHDPIDADNAVAKMEEKIRRTLDAHGTLKDYELKQKVNANRAGLKIYQLATQNLKAAQQIGWKNKTKEVWLKNDF